LLDLFSACGNKLASDLPIEKIKEVIYAPRSGSGFAGLVELLSNALSLLGLANLVSRTSI
jgi:hypothetical protein